MNAKFLYAATVAAALASTLAQAEDGRPLSRAEVAAEFSASAANGTLRKTDYDFELTDRVAGASRSRADVVAEVAAARQDTALLGPLRNRTYNPYGTEVLSRSARDRADVKAEVLAALREGSLRRTEYDDANTRIAPAGDRSLRQILARTPAGQRAGS